jgi:hypothetical protein
MDKLSSLVFIFCDGFIPVSKTIKITASQFNEQSTAQGFISTVWAEDNPNGVAVTFLNENDLDEQYSIVYTDQFIKENPEGIWSQFESTILKRLNFEF